MRILPDLSLHHRLTLVMALTTAFAGAVAAAGLLAFEAVETYRRSGKELSSLGELVAANSAAALALGDRIEEQDRELRAARDELGLWLDAQSEDLRNESRERRRSEERLRLQEAALTATVDAVVITDREGRIQWVNPAFTRLTGYAADEAIGGNPRLLKSGAHPPEFYAELWQDATSGCA